MYISSNHISYKARIIIKPPRSKNDITNNTPKIQLVKNKKHRQGILTKLMTIIIKPLLNTVLKNPS